MSREQDIKRELVKTGGVSGDVAEFLASWMVDREKEQRRVHEFKEEIKGFINKNRSDEKEFEKKFDLVVETVINPTLAALQEHMRMLHEGLNRAEARVNAAWNTMGTMITFVKERMVAEGRITADEFDRALMECGERLFTAGIEHAKSERARIQKEAEQYRNGLRAVPPDPVKPPTANIGVTLAVDLATRRDEWMESEERKEMARVQAEIDAKEGGNADR